MPKQLHVTMPDASIWAVPYRFVAEHRASNIAKEDAARGVYVESEVFKEELATQDDADVLDWAQNNLNWSDVSHLAIKVLSPARTVDYQAGWTNGKMVVVDN